MHIRLRNILNLIEGKLIICITQNAHESKTSAYACRYTYVNRFLQKFDGGNMKIINILSDSFITVNIFFFKN